MFAVRALALLFIVLASIATGCSNDEQATASGGGHVCSEKGECPDGERCDAGFCVPTDCTTGTLSCGCHSDGTCDAPAGVPLTCLQNMCVQTAELAPGSLGASCQGDPDCNDGSRCVAGQCELPGCPSGKLDCPCGPYGSCEPYAGAELRCSDAVSDQSRSEAGSRETADEPGSDEQSCGIGWCPPGSAACACREGSSPCDGDLVCRDERCLRPRFALQVDDAAVRACDVVVEAASGGAISEVRFSRSARGQEHARAPRWGLSFFHERPEPFSSEPLWLETSGPPDQKPAITQARCFDESGSVIPTPDLDLRTAGGVQ